MAGLLEAIQGLVSSGLGLFSNENNGGGGIGIGGNRGSINEGYNDAAMMAESPEIKQLGKAAYEMKMTEQANPQVQQDSSFLGKIKGFFGNRENMAKLALAYANITGDVPFQKYMGGRLNEIKNIGEYGTKADQVERLSSYLRQQGQNDLANLAKLNPDYADKIISSFLNQRQSVISSSLRAAGRQGSGGPEPLDLKTLANITNSLRDDMRPIIKDFNQTASAYERIRSFYKKKSGVSDYALAVAFAKILDPVSAAREGEVAAVAGSGALLASTKEALINAIQGQGKLPANVRNEIYRLSNEIYGKSYDDARGSLEEAESYGREVYGIKRGIYFGKSLRNKPLAPLPIQRTSPPETTGLAGPKISAETY